MIHIFILECSVSKGKWGKIIILAVLLLGSSTATLAQRVDSWALRGHVGTHNGATVEAAWGQVGLGVGVHWSQGGPGAHFLGRAHLVQPRREGFALSAGVLGRAGLFARDLGARGEASGWRYDAAGFVGLGWQFAGGIQVVLDIGLRTNLSNPALGTYGAFSMSLPLDPPLTPPTNPGRLLPGGPFSCFKT